jgi:dipeptidyl aminopeptidase/acylaminoacyl peptidase
VTRFADLREFIAIPRLTSLRLSPDGRWLAAVVQALDADGKKYGNSIWRIDTTADAVPPVRLTRSAEGEAGPEFLPDGSLLFVSKRPGPPAAKSAGTGGATPAGRDGAEPAERATRDADADADADKPALWLLPAGPGEARRLAAPLGGVTAISAARSAAVFVCGVPAFPGTGGADEDASRRKARKDAGVTAILHESGLVRYWDHDLGPDCVRLAAAELPPAADGEDPAADLRDLTPDPARALDEQSFELAPDGSAVVSGWRVPEVGGDLRSEIAVIGVPGGARQVLLSAPDADFHSPRISPDGRLVAAIREEHDTHDRPGEITLVLAELPSPPQLPPAGPETVAGAGESAAPAEPAGGRDLLPGFDRRPEELAWAPDSSAVYFAANDEGRRPVFRVGVAGGAPIRVTAGDGAYQNLEPAPDGSALYAIRSAVNEAPVPVRIDLSGPGSEPVPLPCPGTPLELPGRLEELTVTAADGTPIRSWLVLPESASAGSPAPLLLWVHGGPMMSWNAWSWRWNPWLAAARGYAVLLPDPALSTGYGQQMIARGYADWGGTPYTDVMTATDATVARPDIDASRTAMMGGSFGGYMANWIAGHTDRFRAIVSHAGLWALDQFYGTTDAPPYWRRWIGDPLTQPERYLANSPNQHAASIVTPMLIIHGDKDYRVPVGEAMRL